MFQTSVKVRKRQGHRRCLQFLLITGAVFSFQWAFHTVNAGDDYPVRLVGGNTETEGRVEIFFYGQWGTICSSEWDPRDASVVCRQLGLYGPNTSVTDAYFGEGSGHVLMKNVQCIGNETHLSDCAFQGWGNDCFHNLDASVLCQIGEDFPVRLVGREDTNGREGLLQVAFRGEWGAVCGSGLQALSSIVICRLLGYNGTSMSYPVAVRSLPAVNLGTLNCSGDERTLTDCAENGWGKHGCFTFTLVVILCQIDDEAHLSVRLRGGWSNKQGRLEVYFDGQWGIVDIKNWNDAATSVVCRQLGILGHNISTGYHTRGQENEFLYQVKCQGSEAKLADCQMANAPVRSTILNPVGIVCQADDDHRVRLLGGQSNNSGLVQVFFNGHWKSVCREQIWSKSFPSVVCSQLGYRGRGLLTTESVFAIGNGPDVDGSMMGILCNGTERRLTDCAFRGWTNRRCYGRSVGVICQPDFEIRLVDDGSNTTAGLVEVLINGEWGAACGNGWSTNEANVVCRQLGYQGTSLPLNLPKKSDTKDFLQNVDCRGDEESLLDCTIPVLGLYCRHHAGVICQADDEFPIRLVGGLTNTEGRVEILFRGRWASVEDDGWDRTDSGVVCRQLGFGGPSLAVLNIFGEGRGPTRMNRVNCQGNEDRLIDCPFSTSNRDFIRNDFNPKQSHLGVTCQTEEAFQVRLVGGPNARSGRVELQFRGQWGAVCGAVWATADASVVCRQLGFDGASIATAGIVSHETFQGSVYIDVASCRGNESRLIDCEMKKGHRLGDYHCAGSIYAEAICQADEDFPVRLMDGASDEIGRVEVYVSGQWGSVCSSNWNIEDARVVCNQLGFDGAEASVYRPLLPPGTGPVFMNSVRCVGNESKLAHCQFHGWKTYAQFCGSKRVGVVCKDVFRRTCPPPEARLDYSGLYVISVLVPRGDSSANVSWSKPVVKNQPEKSVEYTTCQQVGGNATPWPCQSGDQFNVTYNWRVQKVGWDTLVEYVVLDRSGSKNISHTCSFYVSVREKAFDNALAPVRPPLDREVISTLQPVVSVLVNCTHNVTFDPILGPLTWLETMPGTQAECVERCPPVSQKYGMPLAVRNCSTSGIEGRISRWQNPEIRNCGPIRITTDLKQVSQLPVVRANVTTVAEYLASKTSKTSKFDDVTLEHASDILHVLACMGVGEPKITDYLHEAVSNIMKSLHANRGSDCRRSRSLVSIRDSIQTQISSSLRQEGAVRIHKEFIQAKAVGLNLSHVGSDLSFAWFKSKLGADTLVGSDIRMYDSISEIPGDASTTISLSGRVLQLAQAKLGNNTFEQIHATFVIYGDDTLFPSYRMTKSEGGNHFTFPGGVVSISVDDVQLTNHSVPVVVEFQVPVIDDTQFAVCVFWDFTLENGAGDWSNVGCEINLLTNGRYRCLCNQATHFAIYLEMARELRVHQRKLDPIVRISCIISASFYLLLLAFLTLRRLRGSTFSPSFAQFILSLLMLYLVFTAGVDTAKGSAFWCVVVSALLQYLPLTTLVWTAIEARSVYVSARPTDQAIKSPVRVTIASLLAWGLPMLVTGGSLFLTFDLHGRGDFCLLGDELPLYFGIGLPFWLILIHNLVHSGLVLAIICKTWNQPSSRWIIGQLGAFIGTYTLITATCYFGFQTARYPSGSYTYIFCAAIFIQMIVTCCALLVKLRETFDAGRSKAADDKSEAERESPLQDSSEVTISPPVSCGSKGLELNIMESGIFD